MASNTDLNSGPTPSSPSSPAPYYIGTATRIITPSMKGVSLGGFFRRKHAEGTLDELHARAIFLTNHHDPPYLLIACELLGVPFKSTQLVRAKISKETGIPVKNISIHGTHTHSAPDLTGIFRVPIIWSVLRAFPERDMLVELHRRLVEVGMEAADPANLKGPVYFGLAHRVPDPPLASRRRGEREGMTRPVSLLAFSADPQNPSHPPEAVVVNYAAHPTFIPGFSNNYSADYPGRVIAHVNSLLQTDPEKTTTMYLNGACGDVSIRYGVVHKESLPQLYEAYPEINPESPSYKPNAYQEWSKVQKDQYHLDWRVWGADSYGRLIAENAFQAYKGIEFRPLTGVHTQRKTLLIRLGQIPFPRLKWSKRYRRYSLHKLKTWLSFKLKVLLIPLIYALINRGMRPHFLAIVQRNRRLYVRTEIQAVALDGSHAEDQTFLLYAPGEPFAALADQTKALTKTNRHIFAELMNDSPGYIFPYKEFLLGGYENMFAFSPLTGEAMLTGFREIINNLLNG